MKRKHYLMIISTTISTLTYTTFPKIYILFTIYMFLLTAYYVIFYMCLLFTLWRMNKYQLINQSININKHKIYILSHATMNISQTNEDLDNFNALVMSLY